MLGCRLQDSEARLVLDMDRAKHEGYCFGAKMVRGAYMFLERARAESMGLPSPIHDTITDTHLNYDRSAPSAFWPLSALL